MIEPSKGGLNLQEATTKEEKKRRYKKSSAEFLNTSGLKEVHLRYTSFGVYSEVLGHLDLLMADINANLNAEAGW